MSKTTKASGQKRPYYTTNQRILNWLKTISKQSDKIVAVDEAIKARNFAGLNNDQYSLTNQGTTGESDYCVAWCGLSECKPKEALGVYIQLQLASRDFYLAARPNRTYNEIALQNLARILGITPEQDKAITQALRPPAQRSTAGLLAYAESMKKTHEAAQPQAH